MQPLVNFFASTTYGSGAYGSSTYQGSATTGSNTTGSGSGSSSGSGSAGSSSGTLSNTGFDIVAAVTVACVIIFLALIIRFWKRPHRSEPKNNKDNSELPK
jgi:hypothetical protein